MNAKMGVAMVAGAVAMAATAVHASGIPLNLDPGTNFMLYSSDSNDGYSGGRGMVFIADEAIPLDEIGRIVVVGAGKAGAGMASGVLQALGKDLLTEKQVTGWVNVPDHCVRALSRIHLHPARPAARNEPTSAGVTGAEFIYQLVHGAEANNLVICLLSGGGSANV